MANRSQFKMSVEQRRVRHFSEEFKRKKVRELETGQSKIAEIVREYEVTRNSVYNWMDKFGTMKKKKPIRLVVETESDTKRIIELKEQVADLERKLGQKQILIDFKDKMIELAEERYGVDIKKNFSTQRSATTGKTGKS